MAVTWSSRSVSGGEFGGGCHHGIADGVPGHTQYVSDPGEAEAVNNDHLHRQRYCVFPLPGLLPGGCCGARPENKRHSGNAAPLLEVWWVSTYGGHVSTCATPRHGGFPVGCSPDTSPVAWWAGNGTRCDRVQPTGQPPTSPAGPDGRTYQGGVG